MNRELFIQAVTKFMIGIFLVAVLLFLPAGSFAYWNAWLLMGVLFVPMFARGIVLMIKNPELLKKRLNAKEKEEQQKEVTALSGIMFILGFVLAGLGFRFHWFILPKTVSIAAAVVFLLAMYAVTVLLFLSTPILLGSVFSFAVFCIYPFILAKRIRNEEEVLTKELAGYGEYKKKVKYRMIPFIW